MRTTKPISTISFNSKGWLLLKLRELQKAKILSFWAFIEHKPEDDEGGKKTHYHVYCEPSKMLQTDDLREELKEPDPENPVKPKGCLKFESSKFDHWYLYALHDRRYLATKGQSRRFHYQHDDFIASNDDDLLFMAKSIDVLSLSPFADMEDAIKHGITWPEYFRRGTVPLPQVALFEKAWGLLSYDITDRANRSGHAMELNDDEIAVIDENTGEVILSGIKIDDE